MQKLRKEVRKDPDIYQSTGNLVWLEGRLYMGEIWKEN